MIDCSTLEGSLKAFHENNPEACEAECLKIPATHKDHSVGQHLLAWSLLERELDYADLLDKLLISSETNPAKGIPAKATLGWLLWNAGRTRDAIRALTENIEREPYRQDLQTLLGICLLMDDQPAPAALLLESVVRKSPGIPVPAFHHSHALLRLGDWEKVLRNWKTVASGKLIVIAGEQGFGDQIQFVRFATHLKRKPGAAEVHFSCHPALIDLMQSVECLDSVTGRIISRYDYHVPVMSLPHRCRARLNGNLYSSPYLTPPESARNKWNPLIPVQKGKTTVGICWRSAPLRSGSYLKKGHGVNFVKNMKSLPVTDLKNLLSKLNRTAGFICLQIDPTEEETELLEKFNTYIPVLENFADTAAIIWLCDHIITIDTAVAHLAGAVGSNSHVVLPKGADWRWKHKKSNESVWYPRTRLYRQKVERSWEEPINSAVNCITCGA